MEDGKGMDTIARVNLMLAFVLVGGALVGLGALAAGPYVLFAWLGGSFCMLGMGHVGLGAAVLGKEPSGRISTWARVLHLPFFVYTQLVWHSLRLFTREEAFHRVTDDLIVGRRLLPHEVTNDIRNYVDLTAEFEEPGPIRERFNYVCLPILDGGVPKSDEVRNALRKLDGGKTYVHCAQGYGRTALFTILLLAEQGVVRNLGEGMELLRQARPRMRLTRLQASFVEGHLRNLQER